MGTQVTMRVHALAALVRRETETWARSIGASPDLLLQCAVASCAFVDAAAEVGIQAIFVGGMFAGVDPADPHFWALAWEDGRCLLVDLTLTQYFADAPPAAVLEADDPGTGFYLLGCGCDEALANVCAADRADARVVLDRVRAAIAHPDRGDAVGHARDNYLLTSGRGAERET